jgi:hypothetical protein
VHNYPCDSPSGRINLTSALQVFTLFYTFHSGTNLINPRSVLIYKLYLECLLLGNYSWTCMIIVELIDLGFFTGCSFIFVGLN